MLEYQLEADQLQRDMAQISWIMCGGGLQCTRICVLLSKYILILRGSLVLLEARPKGGRGFKIVILHLYVPLYPNPHYAQLQLLLHPDGGGGGGDAAQEPHDPGPPGDRPGRHGGATGKLFHIFDFKLIN